MKCDQIKSNGKEPPHTHTQARTHPNDTPHRAKQKNEFICALKQTRIAHITLKIWWNWWRAIKANDSQRLSQWIHCELNIKYFDDSRRIGFSAKTRQPPNCNKTLWRKNLYKCTMQCINVLFREQIHMLH